MKTKIFYLIIGFSISFLAIYLLFVISTRINRTPNNFIRMIPPHVLDFSGEFRLESKAWSLNGATPNVVYLGNKKTPNLIAQLIWKEKKRQFFMIGSPKGLRFKSPKVTIDSPYFSVSDGQIPTWLSGKVNSGKPEKENKPNLPFLLAIAINSNSYIVSLLDIKHNVAFGLKSGKKPLKIVDNLLRNQSNSIISDDGMLVYNKELSLVIYISYHKNQFTVLDTNLRLAYYGKTIDTVAASKVKVERIGTEIKLSAPSIPVNKKSCTEGGNLYIFSSLKADNEIPEIFSQSAAIDIYSLKNGVYKRSFYIPDYKGEKIHDFKVVKGYIYALYDKYLCRYKINQRYLK